MKQDRNIVLDDEKQRILDFTEYKFIPPETGIYEGNLRYYAAALEWAKFLEGHIAWLASVAAWPNAEDERYHAIQQILIFLRGVMPTEVNCGDIENCLESSPTITNIENNITTINQTIQQNEADCGCGGGMVNPEPPSDWNGTGASGSNAVCGSAFYIADKLIEFITNLKSQQTSGTLENWLVNFLFASGGTSSVLAMVLWDWIAANPDASLITNLNAARSQIAQAFFCNLLDVAAAKAAILADTTINANVRTALGDAIDCTLQSAFDNWAFIGSKVKNEDCSSMCSWTVVWDFAGTYVPDGTETAIFTGNTWSVSGGEFVAGIGYRGIQDVWSIQKTLPPDCRVLTMVHNCNKNNPCSAVDIKSWWRGVDGLQAEQFTANARVTSNAAVNQNWTVLPNGTGAEMSQMKFQHDHFLCSPSTAFGSESHWVKMTGKGARPTN